MSEAQLTRNVIAVPLDAAELANSLTHGIGAVLSVVGSVVLLAYAWAGGEAWHLLGCAVYAFALIGVYAISTLSHAVSDPLPRRRLRVLDQAFIYLLIAGSYTPFALAYLRSPAWWVFLAVMWALAFLGFFSKVLMAHRVEDVAVWLYVVLGWMPAIAAKPLLSSIPVASMWWMLLGGLCYTGGTFFLIHDQRHPLYHAIWHLFVIAGSAWQFLAILVCVGMAP